MKMNRMLGKISLSLLAALILSALSFADEENDLSGTLSNSPENIPPRIDMTMPEEPITLRLTYDDPTLWPKQANVPHPEHAFALQFKNYVESQTGGLVMVDLFGAGQLGTYRETLEMVMQGSMDINIGTGALGSFFAPFQILTIPYLFHSDDIAVNYFENSELWSDLMDQMEEETGLKYLGIGQNGSRNFTNNVREIRKPEDLQGIRFRVMESPLSIKMFEALGAITFPIAWMNLYIALKVGIVDGQENPVSSIALAKLYEVQKYLTMDSHTFSENVMVMNTDKFNSLPTGVQHIIMAAARLGVDANNVSERQISNIIDYEKVASTMQVYWPTIEEKDAFRKIAQPPVIEYLKGEIGAELVESFIQDVKRAEVRVGLRE